MGAVLAMDRLSPFDFILEIVVAAPTGGLGSP
jgi:hypothetical protein